jgi:hypothetical protein
MRVPAAYILKLGQDFQVIRVYVPVIPEPRKGHIDMGKFLYLTLAEFRRTVYIG